MSDLSRRPDRTPRRVKEQRAYRLGVTGAGAGVVAVVTGIIAVLTPLGMTIPFIAVLVAVICAVLFRQTVS
jgi:phosphoribosylcarboxyaminoimidazole (NCAIR) mutase